MVEVIGVVASLLGIVAFFAVGPADVKRNLKSWFVDPVKVAARKKHALGLQEIFDAWQVEDIRIENSFSSSPLASDSFEFELREFEGKLPVDLEQLRLSEIAEKKALAEKHGMTFDNNGSFALRRIDISRPEGKNGKRRNLYKLVLEPTDYYNFVFPNLCLDKSYFNESTQEYHSLRDMTSLHKEVLSISSLDEYPNYQFKVGVGTLLVTSDDLLICSVRSKKQFVAAKQGGDEIAVHLSAAEGMYRSRINPTQSDCVAPAKPSPFVTSLRSLTDELNLESEHFDQDDLRCLGYFFDTKRAQPFFLFYVQARLTSEELFSIYSNTSTDIHENEAIFAVPKELEAFNRLFGNCFVSELDFACPNIYRDFFKAKSSARVRIASNHAKAGFATFAFKEIGPITGDMI